jgi:predicted phage tail protein
MRTFFGIMVLTAAFLAASSSFAVAIETAPRISDREIVERLTRLEEGQKAILREMDKRFEAMDKRFEDMDKRFEAMDKRFEDMNKHLGDMVRVFMAIVGAFAAIVVSTIGFALWDRRTMIRPFEDKVKTIEATIAQNGDKTDSILEFIREVDTKGKEVNAQTSEAVNRTAKTVNSILDALSGLGKTDEKVAAMLRKFNLP